MVELSGDVKVVSAEDRVRMVAFDLSITPLENLSNHTILYVVLTETLQKTSTDGKRNNSCEMRPEVAFFGESKHHNRFCLDVAS